MAGYLTTVTDSKQRTTLTKYRLHEHSLAVETGRYKNSRLPKEERFCQLCKEEKVETELLFLTEYTKLRHVQNKYFPKLHQHPEFDRSHLILLLLLFYCCLYPSVMMMVSCPVLLFHVTEKQICIFKVVWHYRVLLWSCQ